MRRAMPPRAMRRRPGVPAGAGSTLLRALALSLALALCAHAPGSHAYVIDVVGGAKSRCLYQVIPKPACQCASGSGRGGRHATARG